MGGQLTLEQMVGQLMMFGFPGRTIPEHIKEFVVERNLGGIIHFSRNISGPAQITALNGELQELAAQSPGAGPLLIAIDQEGGPVVRLTNGVSVSPGNMALGAAADPALAEQVAAVVGAELRALGFNLNLAPCVDVNSNPQNPVIGVRSFGSDPALVGELGAASIRGFQQHLLAVAKHFPGHGDTELDSHLAMPRIGHDWERLDQVELPPFRRAIGAGVAGILAAHVLLPAFETGAGRPATFSPTVLSRLLRERLGFDGLLFTDCMEMGAITKHYSMDEAAVLAILAGIDIVVVSHTAELQRQAYLGVLEAVRRGRISGERIEQSWRRILRAKQRLADLPQQGCASGGADHQNVMEQVIRRGLTLVRDRGILPLRPGVVAVIEIVGSTSKAEEKLIDHDLGSALTLAGFTVAAEKVGLTCGSEKIDQLVDFAAARPLTIIVSQDAQRYPVQSELISRVSRATPNLIVIGARTPYELEVLPEACTYLAAYTNRGAVWKVVVELLMGKIVAQGRLPVNLV